MKMIQIANEKLIKILDSYKNEIFNLGLSKDTNSLYDKNYSCSNEYLEHIKTIPFVNGHTEYALNINLDHPSIKPLNLKLNKELNNWDDHEGYVIVRPGRATVKDKKFYKWVSGSVYPVDGFMGWHNNFDAPGYIVLLTWSETGRGFFRYQDPVTKEIITINDKPGWCCKLGYFGKLNEPDKLLWHCCSSDELRITAGWLFPNLQSTEDLIEKIQQK